MGDSEVLDQCFKPRDPGMLITPFSPNHGASRSGMGEPQGPDLWCQRAGEKEPNPAAKQSDQFPFVLSLFCPAHSWLNGPCPAHPTPTHTILSIGILLQAPQKNALLDTLQNNSSSIVQMCISLQLTSGNEAPQGGGRGSVFRKPSLFGFAMKSQEFISSCEGL